MSHAKMYATRNVNAVYELLHHVSTSNYEDDSTKYSKVWCDAGIGMFTKCSEHCATKICLNVTTFSARSLSPPMPALVSGPCPHISVIILCNRAPAAAAN